MHLLTKGTPFNDLSEGCAVRIKISLYFQEKSLFCHRTKETFFDNIRSLAVPYGTGDYYKKLQEE